MDTFDAGRLVSIQCELASLVARMEGMKAENRQREIHGESPAFVQVQFDTLAEEMYSLGTAAQDIAMG